MKLTISKGIRKSKIKREWDTIYYQIYIYRDGKSIYSKHLNAIYNLDEHIQHLKNLFFIDTIVFRKSML